MKTRLLAQTINLFTIIHSASERGMKRYVYRGRPNQSRAAISEYWLVAWLRFEKQLEALRTLGPRSGVNVGAAINSIDTRDGSFSRSSKCHPLKTNACLTRVAVPRSPDIAKKRANAVIDDVGESKQ
jgi:hypothetical protein